MFCPRCGKETGEDAIYCPFCGTNLIERKTQPTTTIKRHTSITMSVILLSVFFIIDFISIVDAVTFSDLSYFYVRLFIGVLVLVAVYFLWKSKEIGGILGIVYSIIGMIIGLVNFILKIPDPSGFTFTVYDLIFYEVGSIALIILIAIGWKSLK